jgi:hypothetical protein
MQKEPDYGDYTQTSLLQIKNLSRNKYFLVIWWKMLKLRHLKNLQSQLVSLFALTTQSQLHFLSFSGNKNIFSKFFIPVSRDQGLSQEMGCQGRFFTIIVIIGNIFQTKNEISCLPKFTHPSKQNFPPLLVLNSFVLFVIRTFSLSSHNPNNLKSP